MYLSKPWSTLGYLFCLAWALSTRRAEDYSYVISLAEGITQEDSDVLAFLIAKYAGGEQHVYASIRDGRTIPSFWSARLPSESVALLEASPLVWPAATFMDFLC